MTIEGKKQLEEHLEQSEKRLLLVDWLISAFPKGVSRTMLILAVFDIILAILLAWVLTNQSSAERVRDHRIVVIDRMATKDSLTAVKVDQLIEINLRQSQQIDYMLLKQAQAETRGVVNRGTLDTIKQAVSPLLKSRIHSTLK